MWVLFILFLCGQGCLNVRAVPMADEATCLRHERTGTQTYSYCEWRERP